MKNLWVHCLFALAVLVSGHVVAADAGKFDPTFGNGGKRTVGFDLGGNLSDQASSLVKGPDGLLYAVGSVAIALDRLAIGVTRMSPDGVIDLGFGNGGRVTRLDLSLNTMQVFDAIAQDDGKLVVVGAALRTNETDSGLVACRLNANGTMDSTFGNPDEMFGCTFMDIGSNAQARSVVVVGQGELIMAGQASIAGKTRGILVKLDANGIPKDTFGVNGVRNVTSGWLHNAAFADLAATSDGNVVAVGQVNLNGVNRDWLIGRFRASNGSADPDFVGGIKILGFNAGGSNGDVSTAVLVAPDDSILVTGYVDTGLGGVQPAVAKYESNGDVGNFGEDGKKIYDPCHTLDGNCNVQAYDLVRQPSGDIVVVGTAASLPNPTGIEMFAVRLSPSGVVDETFGTEGGEGFGFYDVLGNNDSGAKALTQGNRVLLAGSARINANNPDFAVVRLDHGSGQSYSVTSQAGSHGLIAPNGVQFVPDSSHVKFTITPENNYVPTVTGCEGTMIGNVYTTGPVTQPCIVSATFNSNVTVTYHAGENGSLSGQETIQATLPYGSNGPTVTASPDEGYYFFSGWSDGVLTNPRNDLNVTSNIDVTAHFTITSHKVFITHNAGGNVTPGESVSIVHGQTQQLTIAPSSGFGATVTGCDGMLIGNTYITGPVIDDCTVSVIFTPSNQTYSLNYMGDATCLIQGNPHQQVAAGTGGTKVMAQPSAGHFFVQWSDGITDPSRQDLHVMTDIDVTATCAPDGTLVHLVTPMPGEGGGMSPPIAQQVADGGSVEFTILPKTGFGVVSIDGCPNGTLIGNTYTTGPVAADCTVTATFQPSNTLYTLKYGPGPGGQVNGDLDQSVLAGADGTEVTAQAAAGSFFVTWSDGHADLSRTDTHVVGNIDVTALFATNGTPVHTVTPAPAEGGGLSPFDPIKVADGMTTKFTVLPSEGFAIKAVQGCGGVLVGNEYTTGPITEDCTVQAAFTESDDIFTLTYTHEAGGTLDGETVQVVAAGGTGSEVTAVPANGFQWVQWSDGWTEMARKDANVIGDINAIAKFAPNGTLLFTVTPAILQDGSFTPNTAQQVAQGGTVQFTIVPAPGLAVGTVSGCGDGTMGPGNLYTTAPILADCTLTATFLDDRIFANDFEVIPDP